MWEAGQYSVCLEELQAAASQVISRLTHAEAGIVTAGASAALTLAAAACICCLDVAKMDRLPDTSKMPNEVIKPWHQISGFDHAIRAAGAELIGVGIPNSTTPPQEVRFIQVRELEAAISEQTVAIAYAVRAGSHPPLEEVIALGKRYGIPVIVDAAAQIPPVENLHRFIDLGADLVCFSGGKGIRGPQNTGILCGKKDLIASAALQMLDMAVGSFDDWEPPTSLIPKDRLKGVPEHGIGRSMKVSKEAIIGLLVALERLATDGFDRKAAYLRTLLQEIGERIQGVPGVALQIAEDYPGAYPMLAITIDEKVLGKSAADISKQLKAEGIYPRERYLHRGVVAIHSLNLDERTAALVGERLAAILN
jgi:L-seryl-tRNA(Ser) seleniumtransferase